VEDELIIYLFSSGLVQEPTGQVEEAEARRAGADAGQAAEPPPAPRRPSSLLLGQRRDAGQRRRPLHGHGPRRRSQRIRDKNLIIKICLYIDDTNLDVLCVK
jgi:hypothetical protein